MSVICHPGMAGWTCDAAMPDWTSSRPLLVGLCPPPDAPADARLLDGLTAARLLAFTGLTVPGWMSPLGVTPAEVIEGHFDVASLYPAYQADRPVAENRARASAIPTLDKTVVLLGREVQAAFRHFYKGPLDFYCWVPATHGTGVFGCLPHPSPLCRLYNKQEHRRLAGRMLRRSIEVAA